MRPILCVNHLVIHMKSKQLYFLAAVLLLTACGAMNLTPEERAKRKAALEIAAKQSLVERHFRINVTELKTERGGDHFPVSGSWLKVDSNTVDCDLPYIGLDDIPRLKTRAEKRWDSRINFTGSIEDYLHVYNTETNTGTISFKSHYRGMDYKFTIVVEHVPDVLIIVQPEARDDIFYEGVISLSN